VGRPTVLPVAACPARSAHRFGWRAVVGGPGKVERAQEALREAEHRRGEELVERVLGEVDAAGVEVQSTVVRERHLAYALVELSYLGWGAMGQPRVGPWW